MDQKKCIYVQWNQNLVYLFDETQEIAKAYDAACTPDIYLFNHDLKLVYRGQFDDSRPGNNINPTEMTLKICYRLFIESNSK